jgi:hypothetical protein
MYLQNVQNRTIAETGEATIFFFGTGEATI